MYPLRTTVSHVPVSWNRKSDGIMLLTKSPLTSQPQTIFFKENHVKCVTISVWFRVELPSETQGIGLWQFAGTFEVPHSWGRPLPEYSGQKPSFGKTLPETTNTTGTKLYPLHYDYVVWQTYLRETRFSNPSCTGKLISLFHFKRKPKDEARFLPWVRLEIKLFYLPKTWWLNLRWETTLTHR